MNEYRNYRLGAFVVAGVALIVAAVVGLGTVEIFKDTLPAETYFNESVQGLETGSAVKYRGVQVGRVSQIGFVLNEYDTSGESGRYVLVRMQLSEDVAAEFTGQADLARSVGRAVGAGLRIRLNSVGLTGVAYLEINFLDPEKNPVLPISWTPEHLYIPSASSTLSRIENAVTTISLAMEEFRSIDFAKLAGTLDSFITELDNVVGQSDFTQLGDLVKENMTLMRDTLKRVDRAMSTPGFEDLGADAVAAVRDMRRVSRALAPAAELVQEVAEDPEVVEHLRDTPLMLADLKATMRDFAAATAHMRTLSRDLSGLVAEHETELSDLARRAEELLRSLEDLARDARHNPSRMILGTPPQPVNPEDLP